MELEYTKECDVYAFAFIAYEIINDERPFNDLEIFKIARKMTTGERPTFKKKLPKSYKKLIEKCWSQEQEDRPTFEEIVEKLENDAGFITQNVDEKEYNYFINYIKNDKKSRKYKSIISKKISQNPKNNKNN